MFGFSKSDCAIIGLGVAGMVLSSVFSYRILSKLDSGR